MSTDFYIRKKADAHTGVRRFHTQHCKIFHKLYVKYVDNCAFLWYIKTPVLKQLFQNRAYRVTESDYMPPKPKFTKEEIVGTAKELVREKGLSALTARELAKRLGSSPRPIFTAFRSMKEVADAVNDSVMEEFNRRLREAAKFTPAFKEVGMQMIRFANDEPNLFNMLYTKDGRQESFSGVFGQLGEMEELCIKLVMRDYGLNENEAALLFKNSWLHCYGISALCAAGIATFSEEDILKLMTEEFMGLMMLIKSGKIEVTVVKPVPDAKKKDFKVEEIWKQL